MSRLTLTDLLNAASPATRALNPELFHGNTTAPLPGLCLPVQTDGTASSPKSKRRPRNGPLAARQDEEGDSRRFFVRIVSYRRRLLDEDNLVGKYFCDLCRYSGILPSDAPSQTRIVTTQEKVFCKEEERTEIEISLIP